MTEADSDCAVDPFALQAKIVQQQSHIRALKKQQPLPANTVIQAEVHNIQYLFHH